MTTYATRDEAIHHEIIVPLGEFAHEHDIEAIAGEVLGGYVDGYQVMVDINAFWEIVQKHVFPEPELSLSTVVHAPDTIRGGDDARTLSVADAIEEIYAHRSHAIHDVLDSMVRRGCPVDVDSELDDPAVLQHLTLADLRILLDDPNVEITGTQPLAPHQLYDARSTLGMTQEMLANALGVNRVTLARWEQGRYTIPVGVLDDLHDICNERIGEIKALRDRL